MSSIDHTINSTGDSASEASDSRTVTQVRLHDVAHARTGDKGNCLNVSVIPYDAQIYPLVCEQITEDVVGSLFRHRPVSRVRRFELPNICSLNFVIDNVLEGGVNGSLNLDGHGKTLSSLVLTLPLDVPNDLLAKLLTPTVINRSVINRSAINRSVINRSAIN